MSSNFLNAVGPRRLYPLTDRETSGLSHEQQVSHLSKLGVTLIQLREKSLSSREFYLDAEDALRTARKLNIKVIINDRVDIALALKADGVHLGQEDLDPEVARRLLGAGAIVGISTHSLEQAQIASKMPVDYVAIGPIFSTATKKSSNPTLGLEGIRLVKSVIGDLPLVAIGGITALSQEQVLNSGADCVAVINDLWASPGQLAPRFLSGVSI